MCRLTAGRQVEKEPCSVDPLCFGSSAAVRVPRRCRGYESNALRYMSVQQGAACFWLISDDSTRDRLQILVEFLSGLLQAVSRSVEIGMQF